LGVGHEADNLIPQKKQLLRIPKVCKLDGTLHDGNKICEFLEFKDGEIRHKSKAQLGWLRPVIGCKINDDYQKLKKYYGKELRNNNQSSKYGTVCSWVSVSRNLFHYERTFCS
jgi:hypothetical protein